MPLPGAVPHGSSTAAGSDSEAGQELTKARAYFKDLDSAIDPRADEDAAVHTLDDLKAGHNRAQCLQPRVCCVEQHNMVMQPLRWCSTTLLKASWTFKPFQHIFQLNVGSVLSAEL